MEFMSILSVTMNSNLKHLSPHASGSQNGKKPAGVDNPYRGAKYSSLSDLKDFRNAISSRDPKELDRLSFSSSMLVKVKIAWNRNTSWQTRARLVQDPEIEVRIAAQQAPKLWEMQKQMRK
jgi:hypothetical protein